MSENTQQQTPDASGPSTDLSVSNQPTGTVRIEGGRAFDVAGKDLGAANESAPAQIDYDALAKKYGAVGSEPIDYIAEAAKMGGTPVHAQPEIDYIAEAAKMGGTPVPIDYDALAKKHGAIGSEPIPSSAPQKDTGVWAGVKRNTIGAVQGVYHALTDPVTPEESAQLLQKIREHNASTGVKVGSQPAIPESSAQNPSSVALAYHRIVDLPADKLLEKGKDEIKAAKDLLEHHQYWRGGNAYLSGLADKLLSGIPLVGPGINQIAERAESGDVSGAATDVGAMLAMESAPRIIRGGAVDTASQAFKAGKTGGAAIAKGAEAVNDLTGKAAETIKQKTPALTDAEIVQRFIKRPDTPVAQHGTPVSVESPLDSGTVGKQLGGKDLSQESLAVLKQHVGDNIPVGSTAKNRLIAAVEPVVRTINATASKMNKVVQKAPTFTTSVMQDTVFGEGNLESQFNELKKNIPESDRVKLSADADSVLEDADKALNSNDPTEVLEYRRQLGRMIDWDAIEKNPATPKEVQNAARAKVYQQLTGKIHAEIPETVELDKTLQPNLELHSHLESKVGERLVDDPHAATVEAQTEFKKGSQTIENQMHNERAVRYRKNLGRALVAAGVVKTLGGKNIAEILEHLF